MLPVAFFGYHSHGYWRMGCTMCRDGKGGNQSEITKYYKIVQILHFHSIC